MLAAQCLMQISVSTKPLPKLCNRAAGLDQTSDSLTLAWATLEQQLPQQQQQQLVQGLHRVQPLLMTMTCTVEPHSGPRHAHACRRLLTNFSHVAI